MAHQLRLQCRFMTLSDVPADFITNTWYCDGGDIGASPAEVAEDFTQLLDTFYNAVDHLLAHELHDGINVRAYNLSDAEPRVPVYETDLTFVVPATTGLPAECAAVLSYHGAFGSGINKARRRGRVYIGPLNTSAVSAQSGRVLLTAQAILDIKNAANALMAAGDVDKKWATFSPTSVAGGMSIADATNDVVGGWVDNAVDIQRRRGVKATARQSFGTG